MTRESIEGEWNGFIFHKAKPEHYQGLLENIEIHLLPALSIIGYDDSLASDWLMIFKEILNTENNLSILALDKETGEIAGFRIIGVVKNRAGAEEAVPPFEFQKSRRLFHHFVDLHKLGRIDETTDKDEYADFFGVCVIPKFRQRGLCVELYRRAIEISKSRGLDMAKVSFVSAFSRKAGKKNGYKEYSRKLCIEFTDENGAPFRPDVDPKWYLDMGVFKF